MKGCGMPDLMKDGILYNVDIPFIQAMGDLNESSDEYFKLVILWILEDKDNYPGAVSIIKEK
jgi:hypothetical protein